MGHRETGWSISWKNLSRLCHSVNITYFLLIVGISLGLGFVNEVACSEDVDDSNSNPDLFMGDSMAPPSTSSPILAEEQVDDLSSLINTNATLSKDEDAARKLLEKLEMEVHAECQNRAMKEWLYATNITAENRRAAVTEIITVHAYNLHFSI